MESFEFQKILSELKSIRIEIEFIKENMVESDAILTCREKERFDKSVEEFKRGEAVSLEEFENA